MGGAGVSTIHDPQRKLGFNAIITGISAFSALFG